MSIFVVVCEPASAALSAKIAATYQDNFYRIADDQWLISADTTANALAEALGARGGAFGRVLVLRSDGIAAGFHSPAMWEWIRTKGGVA